MTPAYASVFGAMIAILLLPVVPVGAQAPQPWKFRVDQKLYPKAYGVLANERLMFPVDMSDWPVKIDTTRQLFIDDYLIASSKGLTRRVHQVTKHPSNPLISPDKPWEGTGCVWQRVLWDRQNKRFRMWYGGLSLFTLPSGVQVRRPTCYAESKDGIHWVKPELGLHEYNGSKANNIVILTGALAGIFEDPSDPTHRFKGLVWHDWRVRKGAPPPEGYYLFTSPDGIHWTQQRQEPVALNQNRDQPGIGDTSSLRWDSRLKKYIGDTKILFRHPRTMRCRGMMESDDLIHWTRLRMTLYPDALDAADSQIYGHIGFVYESMWVGLVRVMHTHRVPNSFKQTTVELTASRDGRHWTRVGKREEFLPLGKPDGWDPHYQDPCTPPILVGDDLWFYYRSVPLCSPRSDPKALKRRVHRIGLATIRRDRFVSLDAGEKPGQVVTRPLTFKGTSLYVNAHVSPGGYLKAELQDAAGKPLPRHSLGRCKPVTGDTLKAKIAWEGSRAIQRPAGGPLRVAFELKNAQVFAFWLK